MIKDYRSFTGVPKRMLSSHRRSLDCYAQTRSQCRVEELRQLCGITLCPVVRQVQADAYDSGCRCKGVNCRQVMDINASDDPEPVRKRRVSVEHGLVVGSVDTCRDQNGVIHAMAIHDPYQVIERACLIWPRRIALAARRIWISPGVQEMYMCVDHAGTRATSLFSASPARKRARLANRAVILCPIASRVPAEICGVSMTLGKPQNA